MTQSSYPSGAVNAEELPDIGIGIIGYGFMGKTHANAYVKIPHACVDVPVLPKLVAVCGRNADKASKMARGFRCTKVYTNWLELVSDADVSVVNVCSNNAAHFEQALGAIEAGKHVVCEKPLATSVEECYLLATAAKNSGIKALTAFNYRFVPAVRLAKSIIEGGRIGDVYHFRGRYLQQQGHDPDEMIENIGYARATGSGVMLGIGSHIIDLARFLVGEPKTVGCISKTFLPQRRSRQGGTMPVTVDEANAAIVEFENGAIGTIESSGMCTGRKNQNTFEVTGSKGSISFDLEDLNHLYVYLEDEQTEDVRGFSCVSVTEPSHPLSSGFLPRGHNIGWEDGHLHCLAHFLRSVAHDKPIEPYGATFDDGYRVQVVMETMFRASARRQQLSVVYEL